LWRHQSGGFLPHEAVAMETAEAPPTEDADDDELRSAEAPEPLINDDLQPART
jgi:DNA polymerase IIIc chi subunit